MSIWKKFVDFFFIPMPTEVVPEPTPSLVDQLDKIIEEEKQELKKTSTKPKRAKAVSDQITDSVTQAKPKRKPRAKKVKNENIT